MLNVWFWIFVGIAFILVCLSYYIDYYQSNEREPIKLIFLGIGALFLAAAFWEVSIDWLAVSIFVFGLYILIEDEIYIELSNSFYKMISPRS